MQGYPIHPDIDRIVEENIDRFSDEFRNSPFDESMMLGGAIAMTVHRVEANYKVAVHQYFNKKIQLLIPISMKASREPKLALILDHAKESYTAKTVLTLQMAYAKAQDNWLTLKD